MFLCVRMDKTEKKIGARMVSVVTRWILTEKKKEKIGYIDA